MGLFDGLLGGFEKCEKRGDEALAKNKPLQAYSAFKDALKKAKKQDPLAAGRIESKLRSANESFVKFKMKEAADFLTDDMVEYASEALQIAKDRVESPNSILSSEMNRLTEQIREKLGPDTDVQTVSDLAGSDTAAAPMGVGVAGNIDSPESDREGQHEPNRTEQLLDAEFEQMLGSLPPADQDIATGLSRNFKIGFLAHHNEDSEKAIAAFRLAAEETPDNALVFEMLAVSLDLAGKTNEAAAGFEKALEIEPGRLNSRLALASIIAQMPASPGVQPYHRWFVLAEENKANKENLTRALELLAGGEGDDPDQALANKSTAAEFCLANREPAMASNLIMELIEQVDDAQPTDWHMLAVGKEMTGALDEAEAAYKKAADSGQQALFFRSEFAEFALRNRRSLTEAEDLILKISCGCQGSVPEPETLDYYGFILARIKHAQGLHDEALEGITRILEHNPPMILETELRRLESTIRDDQAREASAADTEAMDEEV